MQLSTTLGRLSRRCLRERSARLTSKSLICSISQPHNHPTINSPLPSSKYDYRTVVPRRSFNYSAPRHLDEPFSDPSRSDLFYHIVSPPTPISKTLPSYALSFSSNKPPISTSHTIIGWLPTQINALDSTPSSGSGTVGNTDATLSDFIENPAFINVLHKSIKDGLREGVDEIQKAMAMQTVDGWMHIHDQRNIPALNRVGDPDDIIGTVLVENSEIRPETYQPMPAYRLVTSNGLMQLTPGLAKKLHDALSTIAEAEKGSPS